MMTRMRYDDRIMLHKLYDVVGDRRFTIRDVKSVVDKNDLQRLKFHGGIKKVGIEGKRYGISIYRINIDKI